ncbi:MAG: hypothetical protein Q8P92_04630 [Candidatus Daviesbacteria bacterium]|nr:hypothetical protein [Candidatus Daviesbacteria bacterium]
MPYVKSAAETGASPERPKGVEGLQFILRRYTLVDNLPMQVLFRIIFFALFIILTALFYSPTVLAQSPSTSSGQASTPSATFPSSNFQPLTSNPPPTSPAYTDLFVHNMFHTFSCFSIGSSIIGQPCLTYQVTQNAQGTILSVPILSSVNLGGGALGTTASLIGLLYTNPPIRTADYLASLGKGFGIVKEAQAQGVVGSGNAVLSPILTLWQVSRNIAYIIMIIIFVIIGLMVMFRQRINPQTVITAQAALPGLIIGLILITFSYFFAALLTDIAFVGTNLVGYYFSAAQEVTQPNLVERSADQSVLTIFSRFINAITREDISSAVGTIYNSAGTNVQLFFKAFASLIAFQFGSAIGGISPVFTETVKLITGAVAALATAVSTVEILGWVFWLISIAILIYSMIKLLLRLINTYLNIIFLTITAPFHFLAASLPGRQEIATAWVLNMLCNILAFPAVIGVFYFVAFLLKGTYLPFTTTAPAPLTGSATFPLLGGLDLSFINILLAFGAMLATPAIPDIICRTIGRATQAGQLLGQEIGAGVAGGRGYFQQFGGGLGGAGTQIGRTIGAVRGQRALRWDAEANNGRGGWVVSTEPAATFAQPGEIARGRAELERRIR